jgi:V/A-type H+-transporting ATPase subunit D
MAKIKLTKGELKRQRDALEQFEHFLPTLQLKKQQLQIKIREINKALSGKKEEINLRMLGLSKWIGLFGEGPVDIKSLATPDSIIYGSMNIAGASLPVLESIKFPPIEFDLYSAPYWVDAGIEAARNIVALTAEVQTLEEQIRILNHELRVTTQRVNLFEKVKIPECLENIRRIRIYLGDLQANAV